ncbi:putative cation-transporting ATPase F [uncultured delta proteobacterium]|uniref:Putative cation-transporting ATPase F n=1 Tax=uncultured delta proteobacterium TaxID=34034 RepID=A0A212KF82_9DELT|nr:putative cation-transporting ATPase F [uncultured delta proteobacterium]
MQLLETRTITDWHARAGRDVVALLQSDPEQGLGTAEAEKRLRAIGPNKLPEPEKEGAFRKFFKHFNDILVYILLFGACVTAFMGHALDTAAILIVVVVNAVIGYMQENKAENALAGIRNMLALQAHVERDGNRDDINAEGLTLGDIVYLKPGDKVPADIRLLREANLRIEEAALTGEAEPAEKGTEALDADTALGDRTGMAYSGTTVSAGTGLGIVVAVGPDTEVGKINRMMAAIEPLETPLLRQIASFGRNIALIILGISTLVFVAGLFFGNHDVNVLLLSVIALAIGAIPEGLPAVVSIILALGVQSMARRKAIVRNLPSVETLGSVSVICSDKTGTLTKNEMTVAALATGDGHYAVSGSGYAPEGAITLKDGDAAPLDAAARPDLTALLTCFAVCNDAELDRDETGRWSVRGEPTEGALKTVWEKAGLPAALPRKKDTLPFDSGYKYMAVLAEDGIIYIKGAPEKLLAMCGGNCGDRDAAAWLAEVDALAARGMRTLAAASKQAPEGMTAVDHGDLDAGIHFLGLAGIVDPPREEAVAAVAECREAGIEVKMITGDHAATARAIGLQMGIGDGTCSVEGRDMDAMDDEALQDVAASCHIFARTSPEHKLRLVAALQAGGKICAMTGDGVNDAPALKMADIGIAMGIKGTEVTKEAAEIVLADDNFQTIAAAVEEGRKVYDNLRKTLLFILPTNLAESVLIIAGIFFGAIMILTPVQVLWINLVTSVTISLALAFEPLEPEAMQRPPRDPAEPLVNRYGIFRVLYVGLLMGFGCLYCSYFVLDLKTLPVDVYRTIIIQTIVACECVFMFAVRNATAPFWRNFFANRAAFAVTGILAALQLAVAYVPFMNRALGTAPLSLSQWGPPFVVAICLFVIVEIEKSILRRRRTGRTGATLQPARRS